MKGSIKKYTSKTGKVSWQVTYDLPPDPVTGKRRQKKETAATKKEAEAILAKAVHQVQAGTFVETSKSTIREYLPKWLETTAPTVRPATVYCYRLLLNGHIIPALGSMSLAKLTAIQVQAFYTDMLAAGLSPTTVGMLHAILHRALDQAVKWRLLAHNPCDSVEPPRPKELPMQTWTTEQARTFLKSTATDDLAALWRLALSTGMRRGELLALRWQDVDIEKGTLAVRRTITRDEAGNWTMGEPKSASGRRSVALPPSCVAALKRHRARQAERRLQWGDAWQDNGLVFDRGDGVACNPAVITRCFRIATDRLELPRIRFHDLRHTAATLMLAQGTHPKIVQERLGHSNISMTLDRYSHVSMDMQRDAADRLDEALGA